MKAFYQFLVILIIPVLCFSQTMNIHENSGTVHQFNLAEIDSITFTSSSISDSNTIYFLSDESGDYNIWKGTLSNNAITNKSQLTFYQSSFVKSFDLSQQKIVFTLFPQGGHRGDLYTMNLDGSNIQLIANQPAEMASGPLSWSPDGQQIVFSLGAPSHWDDHLYVATIQPDGSNYSVIITANQPRGIATHKTSLNWTNNGIYIGDTEQWSAWASKHEIYLYDNGNFTNLTNTPNQGERAAFLSPDGSTLVFLTLINGSPQHLYGISKMPASGGTQTALLPLSNSYQTDSNCWYLNDRIIYTLRFGSDLYDLYIMNSDGSSQINLTNTSNINEKGAMLY